MGAAERTAGTAGGAVRGERGWGGGRGKAAGGPHGGAALRGRRRRETAPSREGPLGPGPGGLSLPRCCERLRPGRAGRRPERSLRPQPLRERRAAVQPGGAEPEGVRGGRRTCGGTAAAVRGGLSGRGERCAEGRGSGAGQRPTVSRQCARGAKRPRGVWGASYGAWPAGRGGPFSPPLSALGRPRLERHLRFWAAQFRSNRESAAEGCETAGAASISYGGRLSELGCSAPRGEG